MIIQCEQCLTKYSFDDSLIKGSGVKVRCTRCGKIFFQENPSSVMKPLGEGLGTEVSEGEDLGELEDLGRAIEELGVDPDDNVPDRWEAETLFPASEEEELVDIFARDIRKRKRRLILGSAVAISLVIVMLVVIFLWSVPQERQAFFGRIKAYVPIAKLFDMQKAEKDMGGIKESIALTDVKERIVKNWVVGDMLIIEGEAINSYKSNVIAILVKGKILDKEGAVLAERESYCNNILTDEELRNILTEEEIYKKLENPASMKLDSEIIPPGGKAPFMIIFANPPREAEEFLVELADIKTLDQ